ncbi:hypothetical protein QJS04_geneDACA022138 [Acorus gramineus]|uniref:Uncharacterized protein n=1 Tax=Acorus gramineus TaxID=55184 RepID=A0AAV9AVM6_ACOGR|nr:hypothetical protein QJS04_geneDACA022138 [Acorus gramineus]
MRNRKAPVTLLILQEECQGVGFQQSVDFLTKYQMMKLYVVDILHEQQKRRKIINSKNQ